MTALDLSSRLRAIVEVTNRATVWVAGIAMVLMAVHVSLDALAKYLLSLPIPATLEVVAYYYMPAVAALPIAHVELKVGHVSLEMVFDAFPAWLQRVVLLLNGLLMMAFIGLLTFLAGREALRKFEIGEYMFGEYPLIIWPGRFVFTFGLAFFCLVVVVKTLDIALGATSGRANAPKERT